MSRDGKGLEYLFAEGDIPALPDYTPQLVGFPLQVVRILLPGSESIESVDAIGSIESFGTIESLQ